MTDETAAMFKGKLRLLLGELTGTPGVDPARPSESAFAMVMNTMGREVTDQATLMAGIIVARDQILTRLPMTATRFADVMDRFADALDVASLMIMTTVTGIKKFARDVGIDPGPRLEEWKANPVVAKALDETTGAHPDDVLPRLLERYPDRTPLPTPARVAETLRASFDDLSAAVAALGGKS